MKKIIKKEKLRRKIYISLLFCIFLLAGCSKESSTSSQNTEKTTEPDSTYNTGSGTENNTDTAKSNIVNDSHLVSGMKEEKLDLSEYKLEYNVPTDSQQEYLWTSVTKAENGYYTWEEGRGRLMYFDIASKS